MKTDYSQHPFVTEFIRKWKNSVAFSLFLPENSARAFFVAGLVKRLSSAFLFIEKDKESASALYSDFLNLNPGFPVVYLPASFDFINNPEKKNPENLRHRSVAVQQLYRLQKPVLIVTYPSAFLEKLPSEKYLQENSMTLLAGDAVDLEFLNEWLFSYDYEKTDIVTHPGEFARSGGILDVYPFGAEAPFRIEFDDDRVERIRVFDVETQLTTKKADKMMITPRPDNDSAMVPLTDVLPADTLIYTDSVDYLSGLSAGLTRETHIVRNIHTDFSPEDLKPFKILSPSVKTGTVYRPDFPGLSLPERQFSAFLQSVKSDLEQGYKIIIATENTEQANRFNKIFSELDLSPVPEIIQARFHKGFKDPVLKQALYPDHEIFGRPLRKPVTKENRKKQELVLREFHEWQKGDYIVHADYGVGIYEGLVKIKRNGGLQEVIKLRYKGDDILYVGVHALHKLSKYRASEGKKPALHKIGSGIWQKTKQKTKRKLKKLSFDLLKLYARRKSQKGFAYGPDSVMQYELESSFMYEDTPDQAEAVRAVKRDMESDSPMDRLVCGDVGFGKTEVAVRAAFKAADNGKQVLVLVPTTVLAYQHYRTFSDRLKDFPVTVDYLNRFRTAKERTRILTELAQGKIDIIIGTHALVNDKVRFKDLGLLIIDEEQKFGVQVKEKIKNLKQNIDVLTLTATPIPRTLQFSLMGERDLSLINTPPPNRFPIETRVIGFDKEIIREAVEKELRRGGQVFFVHNRIRDIEEIGRLLKHLVPDAAIAIAHGKTKGKELEKIMLDFSQGKYDILLSTAIIENGLDVPNANTIIVHNAHQFGMADLHQLRGRVGRSNRKAYCYFVVPSFETLTDEARKRMRVLEMYTALGSGFEIAMKDLEIRGAGDLLGAEQSGFINDLGFELYSKILREAVEEVKEEAFKDIFASEKKDTPLQDTQWQTDKEWLIPDAYMPAAKERLYFYRRLNNAKNEEELEKIRLEMIDRFGKMPEQTKNLIMAISLRMLAAKTGFEKIVWKKDKFRLEPAYRFFAGNPEKMNRLLQFLQENPGDFRMQPSGDSFVLTAEGIHDLETIFRILKKLYDSLY